MIIEIEKANSILKISVDFFYDIVYYNHRRDASSNAK